MKYKYKVGLKVELDWSAPILETVPATSAKEAYYIANSLVRYYTNTGNYTDAWYAEALVIIDEKPVCILGKMVYKKICFRKLKTESCS